MKVKDWKLALSVLLASVFIMALGYALIVAPYYIHQELKTVFPDLFYSNEPWMMGEFVDSVRPIGYASFLVVLVLIVFGFVTEREQVTSIGTAAFILPMFASFTFSMFFMAGLGILRLLWLPLLDVCPIALRLGDIVFTPIFPVLLILGYSPFLLWISITLVGLAIFLFGIVTWLYGKLEGKALIDFWAYRYSRHPQYLGFLVTSYGLLIRATNHAIIVGDHITGPSLPWVVSALIVVCMALIEEIKMKERHEEGYEKYREKTPFMLPLPRSIERILTSPLRRIIGVDFPRNRKEVAYTFSIYLILIALLTSPLMIFILLASGSSVS